MLKLRVKLRLSALALCALLGAATAYAGQFLQAPQYPTGTAPQAIAAGDFNRDGGLDVAVANTTSNTVSILLGNGNGTFQSKVDYATGKEPLAVAVGDFNGDGYLDIAVTNSTSNTVSVLLGKGDGTFQAKVDYATGNKPQGIAVADLRGDGDLDIIVTNSVDGTVGVFLGNGNGTFKPGVAYATGSTPSAIAVGNFTGNSIPDLAVANTGSSTVSVLLGNGDGTFKAQTQFVTGANPVAIVLADLNKDGNLDIALADQNGVGVCILLGKGNGAFQTRTEYATAASPTGIAVGDFTGSGTLDLAVSAGSGNSVSVLWGKGDGTFQGYVDAGVGNMPSAVVAADFNNDGTPDIVVANSGADSVSVILSNGNKTFQARTDYPAGVIPYSVATADFNKDGILDLAVANNSCPNFPDCGSGTITVLLGNANGTFQGPTDYSTGPDTDPTSIAIGDFNGDGIPDLVVANNNPNSLNYVTVLLGNGNGTFQTQLDFVVESGPGSVAVGDFNGDGKLDLAVTNFNSNSLSILLGNGDGTFQNATNYTVGNGPIALAVGDFSGNDKLDLVVVNQTDNTAGILMGNGDGTFKAQVTYATGAGGSPTAVVVGDFSGKGILDLAIANNKTQQVSVLLGNDDGTFQPAKTYATGANPVSIVAADFNGDGKLDIALASTPEGSSPGNVVSMLLGNGDGTFGSAALYGAGSLSYSVAVGDFNGDGAPDIAVANGGSGSVSVLLNTRDTKMSVTSSLNPSLYGEPVTFTTTIAATIANATVPTGTITLENGSSIVASGTVSNGEASISTTTLPVGSDSLSVVYSGDGNYQPNTSKISQTVQMAGTSTALASSTNPSQSSQTVTFTATVASNTTAIPSGTLTFLDGTTAIGTSPLNSSGVATFSISTLSVGTHSITAIYAGNGDFSASTSSTLSQVVQQGNTSITLISSLNPSTESQSVQFTATVSSTAGVMPAGSITFMDGTAQVGSSPLNSSGVATLSITTLNPGTHSITAVYSGDTNSDPGTSPALSQLVQKASTMTALNAAPTSPTLNQSVTFTATVTPGITGVPTGTMTFMDGATQLGFSALGSSGAAAFSTSTLAAGTHNITASYSGDANFSASVSSMIVLPVSPGAGTPAFTLSATALSPSTVAPGASAESTVTVTASGGLSPSQVTLACTVSPAVSPAATCSLGAVSVSNSTATATLTVSVAGSQSAAFAPFGGSTRSTLFAVGLMIPALLLSGLGLRKKPQKKSLKLSFTALVFAGCLLQVACGAGGSTPARATNSGTPPGTYTVTVTGSATGMPSQTTEVSVMAK